jgi:hypothetical protein
MRKFHRWLSVVFGVFLLWISTTGVMSQFAALVANGGFEHEEPAAKVAPPARAGHNALRHEDEELPAVAPSPAPAAAAAAPFVCPADMTCRPKPAPDGARAWVGYLHHLHSGEEFGPAGTVISILSGFALMFFAFSGLWMYVSMWRNRAGRAVKPRWFWR